MGGARVEFEEWQTSAWFFKSLVTHFGRGAGAALGCAILVSLGMGLCAGAWAELERFVGSKFWRIRLRVGRGVGGGFFLGGFARGLWLGLGGSVAPNSDEFGYGLGAGLGVVFLGGLRAWALAGLGRFSCSKF